MYYNEKRYIHSKAIWNDIRQCEEERKNLEILKYLRTTPSFSKFDFNEVYNDLISEFLPNCN